jgi:membrane fusion protein, heavy metal efflux system
MKYNKPSYLFRCWIFLGYWILCASHAWAGPGHDHGESQFASSAVATKITLPPETIKNLDIKTIIADLAPIQESVEMLAQIQLLPEYQAVVSPPSIGRISAIHAQVGETVKKGQTLFRYEPITVGSSSITLSAPIDGVIMQQAVKLGQTIQVGDVLTEIANRQKVFAKGMMYETGPIDQIKKGQRVLLHIESFPKLIFSGHIERMAPMFDDEHHFFFIYALIDNPQEQLIPHMSGSLRVELGDEQLLLTIPERAILGSAGHHFVYIKDGAIFERRMVELGITKGGVREIISGIFPAEEVVVQGQYQLQYLSPDHANQQESSDHHGHHH